MDEIACIAVPRFSLVAACGQRRVSEEPIVLVSGRGPNAIVSETSRRAESLGVRRGMRLARALGTSASIRIGLPDPAAAEELWETVLVRLESLGAAVEEGRPGEAHFGAHGLRGLYGGSASGVLRAVRKKLPLHVRSAVAPSCFAAFLAAVADRRRIRSSRGNEERILGDQELVSFLRSLPVSTLAVGPGLEEEDGVRLVDRLENLGIPTLGAFERLGADQIADRFGRLGLRALALARGEDRALSPRPPREELREEMELPDGAFAGEQLERAIEIVVERRLEQPQRRGRTVLAVRLSARLQSGGSWTTAQTLGQPTSSARVISGLLRPRLENLAGPPATLVLRATALGPPAAEQLSLQDTERRAEEARLQEKIRQLRSLQGPDVVLGIVDVEPGSRVPERWATLAPYSRRR